MGLARAVLQVRLLYSGAKRLSIARAGFDIEKSAGRCLGDIHRRENGRPGLAKDYDATITGLTDLVITYLSGIAANHAGNLAAHLGELRFADDRLEDAQLHRLAVTLQQLEEFRSRPVIRDVIHDNDFSHWSFVVGHWSRLFGYCPTIEITNN